MPEMTSYAPGTPSWVDLGSPDLEASIEFYGALFGWDVPVTENSEQFGGYRQAMSGERPASGMMPLMQEGQPPAWTTYVSVEDADATAAAVKEAGGAVIAEPMDVMDLGRMAIFADPAGAVFGVWQPGTFAGAGVVNEPGAISWNEVNTRDLGGGQGLLRRRVWLGFRGQRHGGDGHLHQHQGGGPHGRRDDRPDRPRPRRGACPLAGLLRG